MGAENKTVLSPNNQMKRLSALLLSVVSSLSLLTFAPEIASSSPAVQPKPITLEQRLKSQIVKQNVEVKKLEQKLQNLEDNTRDTYTLCKVERVSAHDCTIFLISLYKDQGIAQKFRDIKDAINTNKETNKIYQARLNHSTEAQKKKLIVPDYVNSCDIDDCD